MSKKPIKKSDEEKGWLSKRPNRSIKSKLEYHLIICEGTKTEPNYFQAIKEKIEGRNKEKIVIQVVGKGRGTTNLLEMAKKEVRKSTNYISNVWLVYDKDEFTDNSFNEVVEKCLEINKQEETTYNAIWSNESIETWFLLHFIRFDTPLSRKDCISKLNEYFKKNKLGKYKKSDEELYNKLSPYLDTAIENAKWAETRYDDELPSEKNPCTKVYQLVELLNKYI